MCVHTFKHEYLPNQRVDRNQILTETLLYWGKGCYKFWARSDQNSGFHGVTRWTKQAFSCSKFLSPGDQLWANTAFEGSQFYSIGVPKFYSWVNVISVYVYNDLG